MDKDSPRRYATEKVGEMKRLVSEQSKALEEFRALHKESHGCPASRIVQSLFELFDKEVTLNEILKSDLAQSYPAREILQFFADLNGIFGVEFHELNEFVQFIRNYVADFERVCAECESKDLKIEKLCKNNESLTYELKTQREQLDQLRSEFEQLRRKHFALDKELESEKRANEDLDHLNQKLKARLESAKSYSGDMGTAYASVCDQRDQLRKDVRDFQGTLDNIEENVYQEKKALEASLAEERRKTARFKSECASLEEKVRTLEWKLRSIEVASTDIQLTTKFLEKAAIKLQVQKETQDDRLATAQDEIKSLQRKNKELEATIEKKKHKLRILKSDLSIIQDSMAARKSMSSSKQIKFLEQECYNAQREAESLKAVITDLRGQNEELQVRLHGGDVSFARPSTNRVAAGDRAWRNELRMAELAKEVNGSPERRSGNDPWPISPLFIKIKEHVARIKEAVQSPSDSVSSSSDGHVMDDISAIHREMDLLEKDLDNA